MKSANPITDLEQTISQGMKDPFTDPQFVMNRINNEFFGNGLKKNINAGTPMVENSLHNSELMAFNSGFNAQSLNLNSLTGNHQLSDPITQHAIKENNVPMRIMQAQAVSKSMQYPNLQKLLLGARKQMENSKISAGHSLASFRKIPTEESKVPSDVRVTHMSAEAIHPMARASPPAAEAAPEAPPAIEAGLSSPQSAPTVIESAQNIGDTLSNMLSQKGVKSADIIPSNPGMITGREMEDNFSSIKAFLEADNSLRQKKVLDPVTNPLADLMNKKHHVPKSKLNKKIVSSK